MTDSSTSISPYPLLEPILRQKGLTLKGIYTGGDAARIFGVSVRTIQDWCREGKLRSRDLPGRGRFLSTDLEAFLENSLRACRVSDED
jgi:excisionase family DNA binding protein